MAANSEREDGEEHLDIRLRQDEEMEFFTELALHEAERWISAVTRKKFSHPDDFRKSLENGILLCELLNNIKPGSVKRINKLPGAIAGLDNINVFLKSCRETFGLGDNQLFDIGDLEDLSQRAIADSDNLKQEVDRRSLNVAIAIFWLGRSVSQAYSGPQLDQSAFSAIVRYSGKDLLPKERHRNDSVDSSDQTSSAYSSHETNSRVSNDDSLENKHIRDSSCDSFVSKESTPSLDLEDENMPSSVTSKMRRYNSAGSLNTSGGYHFSATSNSINVDDHTNSNHHRRGSSTDSMDSSSYLGNHSRQSSDGASVDIPTRTLKTQRKVSSSALDPMQFVKSKPADNLAKSAQEQIEAAKETRLSRVVIPEKEDVDWQSTSDDLGDWQSNLSSWKHRRRRASAATYQRVEEVDSLTQEEEEKKKPKTYGEMMADRKKRMSTGNLNFYPLEDDDNDFLSTKKTDPVEETIQKKESIQQDTAPSMRLQQRLSFKNRANSLGNVKASYEENEIADWAKEGDDKNENDNEKESSVDKQEDNSVEEQNSAPRNTHDDKFNRGKVSESPKSFNSDSSWRAQSKSHSSTAKKSEDDKSSVNKISNILKSFEKKEHVDYEKPKKKFEFSVEAGRSRSKWQELEKKETDDAPPVKLSERPRVKEHPAKDFTEKNIKINLQKPHNTTKGFGFSISGGVEKKQPITVFKVNIGSAADVCDLQMKDIILSVNRKDVSNMTLPQVQLLIDNSTRQGHVELKVKRELGEDDDFEDETFEEQPTSPQNHSPTWKSPALEPRTHSPKTSSVSSPGHHYKHSEKSQPDHHKHTEQSKTNQHRQWERSTVDHHKPTERKPEHDTHRHNNKWTHEHRKGEEKTESSPNYYQRHHDTTSTASSSQKTEKVAPPVPVKRSPAHREEARLEVSVSSNKWEPQQHEPKVEETMSVTKPPADDEPMWIMDKLKAEQEPVKHAPISDTKWPETNNNDVKQESESESDSEEEEELPISPVIREERSPLTETEVVERSTITLRKNREPEEPTPVAPKSSFLVQESPPPPPPVEAPPPLRRSNLDEEGFKPPDILKRWQRSSRSGRSSSSNSLDSDADKRLSSSSLQAEFNIHQAGQGQIETEPSREPRYDATVGQPVTLQISTSHLIIDPRNQENEEEHAAIPEYSFHVNLDQSKEVGSVLPSRDLQQDHRLQEEGESARRMREKEEELKHKEEELRKEAEKLRLEQEMIRREKEALQKHKQEEEKSKHRPVYDNKREMNGYDKASNNMTPFSASQETNQGPRRLETLWAPDPNKDKQRWSREDMLAMNRKPTPLQKKPEAEPEPETTKEVYHSNSSVPKARTRGSDYSANHSRSHRTEPHNPHSHWMVEEAERRRRADNKRHSVHSYGGPIKPVHQEGLANRWRDDTSIPKQQTYTTNSVISPRSLNTKQFSAEPDKLSQTLPANYNYSHAPKSDNSLRPSRGSPNPPSPSSPPSHAEQIMAVSGKQLCSHCSQELGFGAAMVIESLGLYYHVQCFRCCVCHTTLGNGSQGADVRVRVNKLHCRNCYSNDEAGLKFSKV